MDYKLIMGLALCLMIGVMFVPAFFSLINSGATYGSESEYIILTANSAKAVSTPPIFSFTSLLRSNVSTSSNLIGGNIDDNLSKSLSTSLPSIEGSANLSINCEYGDTEGVNVYVAGNYFGIITANCPKVITGISQALIGDPSTTLTFANNGSSLMEQGVNNSVVLINDTAYVYFYTTNEGLANDDLHVNITFDNPEDDLIEVSFNGFNYVNATGNVFTSGLPVGLMYANGSQQIKFLDLNGTNFDGDNATSVAWSYTYDGYATNFTNATLSYNRWSAYPAANYSTTSTAISANHSGTYLISYVFGTATNANQMTLLNIVVALFVAFLVIIAIRELYLR